MRLKRKKLNENAALVANIAAQVAANKINDKLNSTEESDEEEDAESIVTNVPSATTPATTPILGNQNQQNTGNDDSDPMIEYILQQIKQNRDKQKQEDQTAFAYRQQQADKIVADIENYIKQNKGK